MRPWKGQEEQRLREVATIARRGSQEKGYLIGGFFSFLYLGSYTGQKHDRIWVERV